MRKKAARRIVDLEKALYKEDVAVYERMIQEIIVEERSRLGLDEWTYMRRPERYYGVWRARHRTGKPWTFIAQFFRCSSTTAATKFYEIEAKENRKMRR